MKIKPPNEADTTSHWSTASRRAGHASHVACDEAPSSFSTAAQSAALAKRCPCGTAFSAPITDSELSASVGLPR
jgi:hypothetical protein